MNPTGSVAKGSRVFSEEFGLARANVDLNLERYSELRLNPGDRVFVAPRRVRVLRSPPAQDYSI